MAKSSAAPAGNLRDRVRQAIDAASDDYPEDVTADQIVDAVMAVLDQQSETTAPCCGRSDTYTLIMDLISLTVLESRNQTGSKARERLAAEIATLTRSHQPIGYAVVSNGQHGPAVDDLWHPTPDEAENRRQQWPAHCGARVVALVPVDGGAVTR